MRKRRSKLVRCATSQRCLIPRLWLGRDFPMRRLLGEVGCSERSSTPKNDPDHAIPPAQTSDHPHAQKHVGFGADGSQPFSHTCLAPAASAVAPRALIFPLRLPANTRYVNTPPCLSCPHTAHRKLTPLETATPAGPHSLLHLRNFS